MKDEPLGDIPIDEFREYGHRLVDWIADYLAHPEKVPVLSQVRPGQVRSQIPAQPPQGPESLEAVIHDLEKVIVPGLTHWNHPGFMAYFGITGSAPGILGEFLSAAFNVNAMLWKTSPAATELEERVLDWLRQMIGLPEGFEGIIYDTASVSSMHAIAAAREAVPGLSVRVNGLTGQGNPRLRLYTSEQAHSSIEKAAIALGIGQSGLRKIPVDPEFRMDPSALAAAVAEDRRDGWLPFCVSATVGTTSTTSIDPVPAIAKICHNEGLWLHVDGAYGGSAAIVPEMRWVLEGCDQADSIVVNPHKWLFTPIDLSAFFCRRMDVLRRAFSLVPEYLKTTEGEEVRNYMDYGVQLGRRFRALKLWMIIRRFGVDGLAARIREHIRLGKQFAGWIDEHPDFERLAPVPFSTICFRARPRSLQNAESGALLDELNERLLERINRSGEIFLSHTRLNDKFTLRMAIGNIRTSEEYVARAWTLLRGFLDEELKR